MKKKLEQTYKSQAVYEFLNKTWIWILLILVSASLFYYFYSRNPVRSELSQIQTIATEFKDKNGNFGFVAPGTRNVNCFSGNTFLKVKEMQEVLTSPDVENISCVFKMATTTGLVDAWSVTIVKGEKAFCEDSTGVRMQTPGLTTKEICRAE